MPILSLPAVQLPAPEVRFVFAAPSPYTGRFDATRAGLGIALELQRIARQQQLPVRISLMALPLQAHASADPLRTVALAERLGVDLAYFRRFPRTESDLGPEARTVCERVNRLASADRPGLRGLAIDLGRPEPELRALFGTTP